MRKGRDIYYFIIKLLGLLFVLAFFIGQVPFGVTNAFFHNDNTGGWGQAAAAMGADTPEGGQAAAAKGAYAGGAGIREQSDHDEKNTEGADPSEPPAEQPKKPPSSSPPPKKNTPNEPGPTTGRYLVYKGAPDAGTLKGSYHLLADAVRECNETASSGASYTIVATEHDADMTEGAHKLIAIPAHTDVTLTSGGAAPGGSWTITTTGGTRHFSVTDSHFTLKNIVLDGNKTGGGLNVAGSAIIMESGAVIQNCLNEDVAKHGGEGDAHARGGGGGIHARGGSVITMKGGAIKDCRAKNIGGGVYVDETSEFIMFDAAGLISNEAVNGGGGGVFTEKYENLSISQYAEFSGNKSHDSGVSLSEESAEWHQEVFPTILSRYGSFYSKESENHPVNNFDVNLHEYQVTVHYMDSDERPLHAGPAGPEPDTSSSFFVPVGQPFELKKGAGAGVTAPETIPYIEGYAFTDWAIGSPDDTQGGARVYIERVMEETDVYLLYEETLPSLTISKTVTGEFAAADKAFLFTIYFSSHDDGAAPLRFGTEFDYTGDAIDGSGATAPKDGVLRLGIGGKDKFRLAHGQSITIHGIPKDAYVRVVEDEDVKLYTTSFADSADTDIVVSSDTGARAIGAQQPRSFDFLNNMSSVAHTGVVDSALGFVIPLLIASMFLCLIVFTIEHMKKKAKAKG